MLRDLIHIIFIFILLHATNVVVPSSAFVFSQAVGLKKPKLHTKQLPFQQSHHVSFASSTSSEESISPPLSTPSSSFTKDLTDLQNQLVNKTLTRIAIPSLSAALLCFLTFEFSTTSIFNFVQTSFNGVETGTGYEALNLILTDNSNQFIQNAHNFLALTFSFLTSFTFSFLYSNQVKLYEALFDEVSLLISLMEQTALCTEGRSEVYKLLLESIQRYVNEDLKLVTTIGSIIYSNKIDEDTINYCPRDDLPSILVSRRPETDPLETILYLTSVGQPSYIYSTIKLLRQARAKRLASLQRKMPEVNMYLLYILGFTTWISFPIVTAGSSTVGGEALIEVYRNLLSLGVFAMGCVLGIINELKKPEVGSAYNVDYSILGTLMDGLENELYLRLKQTEVDDVVNQIEEQNRIDDNSQTILSRYAQSENIVDTSNKEEDQGNDDSVSSKKTRLGRRILNKIQDRRSKRKLGRSSGS